MVGVRPPVKKDPGGMDSHYDMGRIMTAEG